VRPSAPASACCATRRSPSPASTSSASTISGRAAAIPRGRSDARTSDAAIVLVHNPDAADQQKWPGYTGWMLAGHTHGGQCKAPFLPPPLLPVQNKDYVSGAIPVSGDPVRTLYISRGVGHLIRARFNARPEIAVFTLRRG
jgi:predicted MPP superfamily phosphohydrolase